MTPPLSPAQRMQGSTKPRERNQWQCHLCEARGYGQNADAARAAGERHFLDTHDDTSETTS
jgi:hypothetical protein